MSARRRALVATFTVVAALLPWAPDAGALAARAQRADLKITAGHASSSPGRVSGSFTVKNAGTVKAPRTSTALRLDGQRLASVPTGKVRPGRTRVVAFDVLAPTGAHVISVCADEGGTVKERKEGNNCRTLGSVTVTSPTAPSDPISYTSAVFTVPATDSSPGYSLLVPLSYDGTHQTPTRLVVFLHGCGDTATNQAQVVKTSVPEPNRTYIVLSLGGRDGSCWNVTTDPSLVFGAIADVKTHFNIAPKQVVVGGYDSGSILAGKTAFANAGSFAGLLVMVGRPFTSDADRTAAISGAAWKINVVWRAHVDDAVFPVAGVRADRDALVAAGFPTTYSEIAGTHDYFDNDISYVFGQIGAGWAAP